MPPSPGTETNKTVRGSSGKLGEGGRKTWASQLPLAKCAIRGHAAGRHHCSATAADMVATLVGLLRQSTAGLMSSWRTRSLYCRTGRRATA